LGRDRESDADTSQVLEFSKEVGEEIIKVALKLILERGSNPRLQSNMAVNQSISDVSTGLRAEDNWDQLQGFIN
jgi:hypothetical protein